MEIRFNMTGLVWLGCGGSCVETDRVRFVQSPNGRRLTGTITAVEYSDDVGRVIPNPIPGASASVGDSFYLEFVAPHLMKQTSIRTSRPAEDVGNPYWCDDALEASKQRVCGA